MPVATFYEVGGAYDGMVTSQNATWATARTGSGLLAFDSNSQGGSAQVGAAYNSPTVIQIARSFLSFNTAATLAGRTVISAQIKIAAGGFTPATHSLNLFTSTQSGASAPLSTSMWNDGNLTAATAFSMAAVIAAGGSGLTVSLNSTGLAAIKNTGTDPTRFVLKGQDDYTNVPPINNADSSEPLIAALVDDTVPNSGIQLIVTYSGAPITVTGVSPANGPSTGGTPLAITGTGFVSGCSVTVKGVPCAAVIFNSSTSLTAITGPSPTVGLGNVVVTAPDSTTGTATNAFTYDAVAPVATSIIPIKGSTVGGTPVTISGTGFSSGGSPSNGVTFDGVSATSIVVVSPETITCVTPAHAAATVDVIVINPNGVGDSTLVAAYTYYESPPSTSAGTQLLYDFTRKIWYSAAYGNMQDVCSLPATTTNGLATIFGLDTDGIVHAIFDDNKSSVSETLLPIGRGFLQTEPVSFGNSNTQKIFPAIRIVVNDVTAIVGGPAVQPWTMYAYVDNSTVPISVTLEVDPEPYNRYPDGMVEGPDTGVLIGFLTSDFGGPVMGHNIRCEIYYPVGIPVGTPLSGFDSDGNPLHLPWAIYQIDVITTLAAESKVEP